jgi:hypothetical protein
MNNIEILEDLEKYISFANKHENFSNDADYKWHKELAGMIENLIKENKELKEKAKNTMELIGANYIHKDKVKAMLEGITKEHSSILSKDIYSLNDKNIATFQYNAMRKILEELLEGE